VVNSYACAATNAASGVSCTKSSSSSDGCALILAWCGGDDVNHRPVGNPKRKV
jgi:hypothetical protein